MIELGYIVFLLRVSMLNVPASILKERSVTSLSLGSLLLSANSKRAVLLPLTAVLFQPITTRVLLLLRSPHGSKAVLEKADPLVPKFPEPWVALFIGQSQSNTFIRTVWQSEAANHI